MGRVKRISVFASGRGSNFVALADAIQRKQLKAQIVHVVTDSADAPVVQKAKERGVNVFFVPLRRREDFDSGLAQRRDHEEKILKSITNDQPEFVVLAGYMRLFTSVFIDHFNSGRGYSRIINIHPSLLPAFPGIHSYAQAFEYGCKWAGVTVHLVDKGKDSGPICAQEAFRIDDCQSLEEVEARGLEVEHRLYPQTLNWVLNEDFRLVGRRVEGPK